MQMLYAKLLNFSNIPQFGVMSEANVTKQVYRWMDNISSEIDDSYWFTVTYIFNVNGLAIGANIFVQKNHNGIWYDCGVYNVYNLIPFNQIKCACLELAPNSAEQKPSEPLTYYIPDYYVEDYYQ